MPRLLDSSEKHAFLLVLSGPQLGELFPLAAGREIVVGRREDCDVQIRDEGVSRRHAVIEVRGEGAIVRDLGSANGTWVDGRREREGRLADGTRLHVGGQTTLKFIWADELEAATSAPCRSSSATWITSRGSTTSTATWPATRR
jgi:pSer/pThr/pTyr-binding forkhead associated (FHA) protein